MRENFKKRLLSSMFLVPLTLLIIYLGDIYFIFFLSLLFFLSIYEWHKLSKNFLITYVGYIFIFYSFYSFFQIRYYFEIELHNILYLSLILFICISTDIGGYLFGKIFKGPKLTKISPNKTYSGSIGGIFLSLIFSYTYIFIFGDYFYNSNIKLKENLLFYVFIVSIMSQIGDLIISYFKRRSNIKDTGNILPGHGGVLDRIDGMLLAFPFSYLFVI